MVICINSIFKKEFTKVTDVCAVLIQIEKALIRVRNLNFKFLILKNRYQILYRKKVKEVI